jgi:hypothetical protein
MMQTNKAATKRFRPNRTLIIATESGPRTTKAEFIGDWAVDRNDRMVWLLGEEEIDAKPDTVERTGCRYKNLFTVIEGGRIGLLTKRMPQ